MPILTIAEANNIEVIPSRNLYVKFPVFLVLDINFDTNQSQVKIYDILESDFMCNEIREDNLIEKEFNFQIADIDNTRNTSRLNLFSLPEQHPDNSALSLLKNIYGTSTIIKKDREPFACSIFFSENDEIREIKFTLFHKNEPRTLIFSRSNSAMDIPFRTIAIAKAIVIEINRTPDNWEYVHFIDKLNVRFKNLLKEEFHLSISFINSIFHRKMIKLFHQDDYLTYREPLIEKNNSGFELDWALMKFKGYHDLLKEVLKEICELDERYGNR